MGRNTLRLRIVWDARRRSLNYEIKQWRVIVAGNDNYAPRNSVLWPVVCTLYGPVLIRCRDGTWEVVG